MQKFLSILLPTVVLSADHPDKFKVDAKKVCFEAFEQRVDECNQKFFAAKIPLKKLKASDNSEGQETFRQLARQVIETKKKCRLNSQFGYAECVKERVQLKKEDSERKELERAKKRTETLTAFKPEIMRMI